MQQHNLAPFLDRQIWKRVQVFCLDYINFIAFLLFLLINITLGRVLHQVDRQWKTRYLDRLIAFFEKLA